MQQKIKKKQRIEDIRQTHAGRRTVTDETPADAVVFTISGPSFSLFISYSRPFLRISPSLSLFFSLVIICNQLTTSKRSFHIKLAMSCASQSVVIIPT